MVENENASLASIGSEGSNSKQAKGDNTEETNTKIAEKVTIDPKAQPARRCKTMLGQLRTQSVTGSLLMEE